MFMVCITKVKNIALHFYSWSVSLFSSLFLTLDFLQIYNGKSQISHPAIFPYFHCMHLITVLLNV